ncbi:hypothetical protein NA57DRAFT_78167 [Rhizodiscina lignyota]|uniref:Uncharacterized protein n=1 Tax=Rhizodiscina lignyota TaxID=1504668 RepID=A0A9P4IBB1_9PEZI|nr:hypothetical protein NA57DRAFT_78167 [Rhizodiscina lignyota]
MSLAQDSTSATSTTTSRSSITSTDASASITPTSSFRLHSTLLTSTSASNSSSAPLQTDPPRPGFPGDDSPAGTLPEDSEHSSGLLNYYFAFLAVFVILLFLAIWYIHRRKKKLKAMRASGRTNALARDLDGWTGSRRWMGGAWRGGIGRRDIRTEDREEGLNELGEAPPPYKARDSVIGGDRRSGERTENSLTVPLRALDRDGRAVMKPPDYHETVRELPESQAEAAESSRANPSSSQRTAESPQENER